MASSINASTSGAGGVITTADNTGILNLQTASTTAVTVDASQNVGIGTTSPSYKFQASNTNGDTQVGIYDLASGSSAARVDIRTSGTGASQWFIQTGNTASGLNGALRFYDQTVTSERMRITSGGQVLIGTSSGITTEKVRIEQTGSVEAAYFTNSNATPYGVSIYYTGATPNNTSSSFLYATDGTLRFKVASNGGVYNYSANNSNLSDERLKTNILPATNYLDKICSIPVVTFKYKDQTDNELNLGVIAQDVDKVAPELVDHNGFGESKGGETAYLSIYQTDLQYALMKCIQEQQTIINDLKARVTALEAK